MEILHLSESFASIQGEGKTAGTPAIFWRFQWCGFHCKWCDTLEVWKKGTKYSFDTLYEHFSKLGYFAKLNARTHHLVITGGDPLIQQDAIAAFLLYCQHKGERINDWYIECENQGQLMPMAPFSSLINLWNISPKLTNSGMSEAKRFNDTVMAYYIAKPAIFKFPVSCEADVKELIADWQTRYHIPSGRIYLMPICTTREEHAKVGAEVAALAQKFGFRFSPRLQVVLWDKTCGV